MYFVIPIAVGSVLLVICGFVWAARRETLERARDVRSLEIVPIDALEPDKLAAVRGKAARLGAIENPVDGQHVAFYEARVEREGGRVLRTIREGDVIAI